jgi:predicted ATPase/class 3 adenylate cyclase
MSEVRNETVTLLFSDIEGSTRLLQRTGDAYAGLLSDHRRLLGEAFERHGAIHADAEGDGFFAVFPSAVAAAAAAAQAQRALAEHPWPDGIEVRVRIGLHSGEPRRVDGSYVGLDVHHAARVMAAGHGGQVLVSEETRALLDERFELCDLGEHLLKDLAAPERLFQLVVDGLRTEFPPLSTVGNRPTNLRSPPNAFIGRSRELEELRALLARADVRLLTLTGTGGTGKSRLAFEVAASVLGEFANGVFFVPLAPVRDPELVVPTIAQTIGLREHAGESSVDALTDYLRDRQLLLVLDNLEQVVGVAPALADVLAAAPGLKIVATSRTLLRLSLERAYAVRPLALDESVPLFAERARAAGADFAVTDENEAAIAEICARLEGLPLAIELAAPRVRTLTPAALLRRLDSRLALLTGGPRDLDERQRTLRATIEWSYDLLLPAEQALFARLGIFVGGCRLDAAEALGDFGASMLDALESLVEKSLLRQRGDSDGEPRFWMLESIREFALERLEASGEAADVRQRQAEWFADLAECLDGQSRTGDQPAAIARLVDDYANLRAAIESARTRADGELLLRLATALWPFWSTRGYVAEGQRALEDALELTGRRPARALLGLASLRVLSVSSAGLLDEVHEALRAAEELGDPLTLAQAWNLLGQVEGTLLGSLARAEEAWQQALAYAEAANLRAERADSIGWLMMSANFGPLPVEEGIARCRGFHSEAADDPFIRANSCIEQAALEAMRGDFRTARELLAGGRELLAELGFTLMVAMSAQEAHYVEILAGDPAAAARISRESYAQLEPTGERAYLSTAAVMAHALVELGELDEAEHFSRVSEQASSPEDVFSQVLWRSGRAKIQARRGELTEAEGLAREAVALAEQTDLLNTRGDTLADLAEVLLLGGRSADAASVLDQAAERFERKGNLVSLERVRSLARGVASATPA